MTALLEEQDLLTQLVRSPRLPQYLNRIQQMLDDETARRLGFYDQTTDAEKAEFINGEVIVHSPVKYQHNVAAKSLLVLLDAYVKKRHLGYVGYEKLMISLTRNDYEPDICFFRQEKAQRFQADQMHFPAPDFIVEVLSASTEAIDRGIKFDDYAAHGVEEYWIIDPGMETLEQYQLREQRYELVIKAKTGEVDSFAVPGFQVPVRALFDDAVNQEILQKIISAPL